MTESSFKSLIKGKRVVYITVKNRDYIRVTQIKRLLEKDASSCAVYTSEKGNPITRALDLNRRLKANDLKDAEVVVAGFLPQLLWEKISRLLEETSDGGGKKPILVAEFFISLYDTVVLDRHLVRDGWWIADLLRKQDKRVLKEADLVLTDTGANSDFLSSLYGIERSKFETIYLEADPELYDAARSCADGTDPSSAKEKTGAIHVLYFGTGLPLQGTDTVLEAFNLLEGIKCTFIGSLKGVPGSVKRAARENPDIELITWLSQEELAGRIAKADLCIAGHFNLYIDKAARTIPGKAYIYEAMGKPMILGDTKANREIFTEDPEHIFVKRGDAESLSEAIKKACYG